MMPRDLALLVRADQAPDEPHLLWLRLLFESGRINEHDLTTEDGERVPDPLALRAVRRRALLARVPVRAGVRR